VARCDLAYPAARLDIEYDGRAVHLNDQAFDADRERDARLAALGWLTLRVTRRTFLRPVPFLAAVDVRLAASAA
jgi:very-short-patch-repair endonuclease